MPDANSVVPSGAPSSAPIASSQADQVALSTRPYIGWPVGTFPAPTKVDDSSTGGPTGAPGDAGGTARGDRQGVGRPALVRGVAEVHGPSVARRPAADPGRVGAR